MTGIDVDTLTREFLWKEVEDYRNEPWASRWVDQHSKDAPLGLLEFVAARVERNVADRIERAMFGDTDGGWISDDSELPVGELRRLLSLARGGSADD